MSQRGGGMSSAESGNGQSRVDPFDLLDYPCEFEIKAMGLMSNHFDATVQGIVLRHLDAADLVSSQSRPSRHGRYVSITCAFIARSKQQIRDIYADLHACPEVLVTL